MEKRNIHDSKEFFEVLQTTKQTQTAVMTLRPGQESGEKGNEHPRSDQILLVMDGEVTAEIGETRATLGKGDVVVVPAGIEHRFSNASSSTAVTFNVYAPPAY